MGRSRPCRSAAAAYFIASAGAIPAFAEPPPQPPPTAAATHPPDRDPPDRDRIERLELELGRLRQELDEERRARAAAIDALAAAQIRPDRPDRILAVPLVGALLRDGLRLGELRTAISGFVQADAVAYEQASEDQLDASGKPLNQTRFSIRRAHLRVDAEWRFLSGVLEVEASTVTDPGVRLFDAEVTAQWPPRPASASATSVEPGTRSSATASAMQSTSPSVAPPPYLALSVGLLRIPFGYENQERDFTRLFLERSAVIRALFPGENDLGARVQGGWRIFRYQLAVMNGHPLGEVGFPALDPSSQKDLLGRLGVDAALARIVAITAGLSGLWGTGFHAGTPATKDTLVWRDANGDGIVQPSEVQSIEGTAATPSQTFERYAVGLDARLTVQLPRVGELCVYGELVWAANLDRALLVADPIAVGRSLRETGGYVGVTQELTRYVLVGLRYDRYNPDGDANDQQGAARVPSDASYSTLAVAAAVQYPPFGRLTVEYDHNTNALGRTTAGLATTLGADALTFRAQLVF